MLTKLAHFFDPCTDDEYNEMVKSLHQHSKNYGYRKIFEDDPSIDAVIFSYADTSATTLEDYPMVSCSIQWSMVMLI
jgi:hypothetical protein